ncbi:signal protein PDZ [Phenylobacterium hankyongense]|uniref:Signal protein PDZ n=1 Tax=Phenylobacterium hankyongense TaxID=1813876 RepID=A0A328B0T1_9CAUL|nr:S1C family serine protease [Phenylobacterium hankyongense]RAK60990.1 signal protein PDZ [Phenylobacterium hankyongense]
MASPFEGYEVEARMRPVAKGYSFDLDRALSAVVALEARIPADAFTAATLGAERLGNGAVIGPNGLVLTIGYLITEAEEVVLTLNDGRRVAAHVLGADSVTGLGLVQALEPLGVPALPLGASRSLKAESPVVIAGAGGRTHAAAGHVLARMPFAGYWEYLLNDAIMTEPAHPHWSGAALIGATGELMGVGSLSLQRQSPGGVTPLNMFVPTELLPPILDDLARGKPAHPPRPWLGVLAQDFGRHVVVVGVSPKGPAARAELRAGDLILAVGGVAVSDLADFYTRLWAQGPAGATIRLRVQRDADAFDVEIRSADRAALLRKPRFN